MTQHTSIDIPYMVLLCFIRIVIPVLRTIKYFSNHFIATYLKYTSSYRVLQNTFNGCINQASLSWNVLKLFLCLTNWKWRGKPKICYDSMNSVWMRCTEVISSTVFVILQVFTVYVVYQYLKLLKKGITFSSHSLIRWDSLKVSWSVNVSDITMQHEYI